MVPYWCQDDLPGRASSRPVKLILASFAITFSTLADAPRACQTFSQIFLYWLVRAGFPAPSASPVTGRVSDPGDGHHQEYPGGEQARGGYPPGDAEP